MAAVEREINSIAEFIEVLKKDQDGDATWFRGHTQADWVLLPGFIRSPSTLSESSSVARFKQNAAMLAERLPSSPFDWIFLMQHYGVATRLLDWSESPLIALFFAVNDLAAKASTDAALWCLNPVKLNKHAGIKDPNEPRYIPSFEDDLLQPYGTEDVRVARNALLPVAAIATRNNPRIHAQMGAFTIHHADKTPIEGVGDGSHVKKYIIPSTARKSFQDELRLLGLSQLSLFPELATVGNLLREMMR